MENGRRSQCRLHNDDDEREDVKQGDNKQGDDEQYVIYFVVFFIAYIY